MKTIFPFWIAFLVLLGAWLITSIVTQIRAQRRSAKHNADLQQKLDAQLAEAVAGRERAERRAQESRDTQHEALDLKRREIALREEQAASLRQLVTMHEELLAVLRAKT
jgi:flagellar biosynthesis/type III secretory pathway M-ring protein FliF/YscJ